MAWARTGGILAGLGLTQDVQEGQDTRMVLHPWKFKKKNSGIIFTSIMAINAYFEVKRCI